MGIIETAVGVVIGAVITVLASRYYFRRSISKQLSVYRLLNSFVFDGITPDVRTQLQFRFQNRQVDELQQVLFLVANTGERAIRDVIECLTLAVPDTVEILDASVVYRQPERLAVDVLVDLRPPPGGNDIKLDFPLMNKGEFFVVKLLLSGRLDFSSLSIFCDDLPRAITVEPLPPNAIREARYKFEWVPAAIGLAFCVLAAWSCYSAYLVHTVRPDLFRPNSISEGRVPRVSAPSLSLPRAWQCSCAVLLGNWHCAAGSGYVRRRVPSADRPEIPTVEGASRGRFPISRTASLARF